MKSFHKQNKLKITRICSCLKDCTGKVHKKYVFGLIVKIRPFYTYIKGFRFLSFKIRLKAFLKYLKTWLKVSEIFLFDSRFIFSSLFWSPSISFFDVFRTGLNVPVEFFSLTFLLLLLYALNHFSIWVTNVVTTAWTGELIADVRCFFEWYHCFRVCRK